MKKDNSTWTELDISISMRSVARIIMLSIWMGGREMMQWYADYMDELERSLSNVSSINFK